MFSEFLKEFNISSSHLFQLVHSLRFNNLFFAIFDLKFDIELCLVCGLNHSKFRNTLFNNFFVITVTLQEYLSFSWGDLKISFVVRVEKHGDFSDLTIETILFHLELSIVLEIVFLEDHN